MGNTVLSMCALSGYSSCGAVGGVDVGNDVLCCYCYGYDVLRGLYVININMMWFGMIGYDI